MVRYSSVEEFISQLDKEKKREVVLLREIILDCHADLNEIIKWNAPSYMLNGEDRITFNINNKQKIVKIVLHMGVTRREDKKADPIMIDETGLIQWSSDIRGVIGFDDYDSIYSRKSEITRVITRWLQIQ